MSKTLLEVVQDAALEMGLAAPSAAAGNPTDLTAVQLVACYNATGDMLVKRRVWRALLTEKTFTTVAGTDRYALPADFGRPVPQTEWNRTGRWPLAGPQTPQQWQWLRSGIVSSGLRERFRFEGSEIVIWPTPTEAKDCAFYYISKWWARDVGGQAIAKVTHDDDYSVFDDRLMICGTKLRFFQAKGFDTTSFAADFQTVLDDALAQDSSAPVLSLSGPCMHLPLISTHNLPDTGYGTP